MHRLVATTLVRVCRFVDAKNLVLDAGGYNRRIILNATTI
jgi:hypothetical protein